MVGGLEVGKMTGRGGERERRVEAGARETAEVDGGGSWDVEEGTPELVEEMIKETEAG